MNKRIARLREQSFKARPCLSAERALLVTEFYSENDGKYSMPVLRALNFKNLCEKKTIYIGDDELIVGLSTLAREMKGASTYNTPNRCPRPSVVCSLNDEGSGDAENELNRSSGSVVTTDISIVVGVLNIR